ncbi:MAG: hypothetical protein ACP5US_09935 [Candidatus Kryptoniota bacterium]
MTKLSYLIRQIYDETYLKLRNNTALLAGAGMHSLSKALCKDIQAKGQNLEETIESDRVYKGKVNWLNGTRKWRLLTAIVLFSRSIQVGYPLIRRNTYARP